MKDIKFVSFAFFLVGIYGILKILFIQKLDFFEYKIFNDMYKPVTATIVDLGTEEYTADWRGIVTVERKVAEIKYKFQKVCKREKIVIDFDASIDDVIEIAVNKKTGKVLSGLKFNISKDDYIGIILRIVFIIIGIIIAFYSRRKETKQ